MKQTNSITMLFLAILSIPLQNHQSAGVCRHETKYDDVSDTTTVQCDNLIKWGEAAAGLTIQANASFRGKEANETAKFWFFLSSNKGGATRRTQLLFREATTLYLSTGSAQLKVPVKDYRDTFFELTRSISESARAEVDRDDLQKLLDAKTLEGKWGNVEFKVSDAALASLKNFISRQVFATHIR